MLIEHLPPSSALARETDPDRQHEWNQVLAHLLVELHHEVQLLRYMWADEDSRGPLPERILRPWERSERDEADRALVAQLRANAAMN